MQGLRQEQHISLGGAIDRHAELWHEAHHRPHVDDSARAGLHQTRRDGAGQPRWGRRVQRHQLASRLGRLRHKVARLRGARVVDQDLDTGVIAQPGLDGFDVVVARQVCHQHVDRNAMVLP
ncbi:hypothetical protein D3C78_1491300 [compost metagenome]